MSVQPSPAQQMPEATGLTLDVDFDAGFYGEERDDGAFRWLGQTGRVTFAPADVPRYFECWVSSEFLDQSQTLTLTIGAETHVAALPSGWSPISLPVAPGVTTAAFAVNKLFPREYYPADTRDLGVRVREIRLHQSPDRHAYLGLQYHNLVLNQRETLEGRSVLRSTPTQLGIDLHGACNVKPPCVYCEWDFSKNLEGDKVDVPFTVDTLKSWGPFFDNATTLVNCSIGEPFMMRQLDEVLGEFARSGKSLQMATNGQILTDRNIQKLLGQTIDLYISLDAATPGTYARLRNDTFTKILGNIRRLVAAKGGKGRPPYVHLVFMPMRVNLHELEAFVRLCADLSVDRLVLRPLNYSDSVSLDWTRAGYHFEYQNELLPFGDLIRASGRATRLAERLGVELSDQLDFGGKMREQFAEAFAEGMREGDLVPLVAPPDPPAPDVPAGPVLGFGVDSETRVAPRAAQTPAAAEDAAASPEPEPTSPYATGAAAVSRDAGPDTLALLADAMHAPADTARRLPSAGTAPLPSLGASPKAACLEPWKSLYILRRGILPCCYGGAPIAPMEDHETTWNSPTLQAIRSELAAGRFHEYCKRSPACPVVRKSEHAKSLQLSERVLMRARHAWWGLNRVTGQRLNRFLYHPLKRTARRLIAR